jgi:hypothetical protein
VLKALWPGACVATINKSRLYFCNKLKKLKSKEKVKDYVEDIRPSRQSFFIPRIFIWPTIDVYQQNRFKFSL